MSGHVWRMGSTGDTPVPVGDSPGGTGQWPTGIELSLGTSSVGRPLPARNERGEGWGEGKSNKNATPLPGPLLLLRRKRGRRARSIPLIQVQCSLALSPLVPRGEREKTKRRLFPVPLSPILRTPHVGSRPFSRRLWP